MLRLRAAFGLPGFGLPVVGFGAPLSAAFGARTGGVPVGFAARTGVGLVIAVFVGLGLGPSDTVQSEYTHKVLLCQLSCKIAPP